MRICLAYDSDFVKQKATLTLAPLPANGERGRRPTGFVGRGRPTGPYLPIIDLAFAGVTAVVGTVTVAGTLSAQSSKIDFAMSIA